MDKSGDIKIKWNPFDGEEVAVARRRFEEARREGFVGYAMNPDGSGDRILHSFDPAAGKIVMRTAFTGG